MNLPIRNNTFKLTLNKYLLLSFVLLLALFSKYCFAEPPATKNWQLMTQFSDEFNDTDLNQQWTTSTPYYSGDPPGYHTESNVFLQNYQLKLLTDDKSTAEKRVIQTGFIKSIATVQYGYFEISAKVMPINASSSFWLYRYTDNATYEIDIAEISGGAKGHENIHHSNIHAYYGDPELENDSNRISAPQRWTYSEKLAEKYHLYGFEWSPTHLRWYFDNQLIRTEKNEHFHLPMHIIMTTGITPKWTGIPEKIALPQVFQIDYIRVWN